MCAPCFASFFAQYKPIPLEDPEITATFPFKELKSRSLHLYFYAEIDFIAIFIF